MNLVFYYFQNFDRTVAKKSFTQADGKMTLKFLWKIFSVSFYVVVFYVPNSKKYIMLHLRRSYLLNVTAGNFDLLNFSQLKSFCS